ncbi:MAG: PAS domain S-box protein [Nitrospirota bacterium]|nr:MAG: PAS domain S-box protein [Nitrospirota bacterium]
MQEFDLSKTRIAKDQQNKELKDLQAEYDQLQQLLDYSPAILYRCQVSSPYACTYISGKVTEMLGYQPSEFVTNPHFWIDHIHPDDRAAVIEGLTNRQDPERHVHEYRFRHKDGTYCWVHDELSLLQDQAGKTLEIVGYWVDISARKQMEEALQRAHDALERRVQERTTNLEAANDQLKREIAVRQQAEFALLKSEKQFHQIFSHSNDAIFVLDPRKDKILQANPRACELLEYSLRELLSTPMSTIHAQEKPRFQNFCQLVQQKGHGWTDELTCQTKTGRILDAEISASTVEREGSPSLIAMVRDITRRKEVEEKLRDRNRILALEADIGKILNQNSDFPSLLQNCTKALVHYLDAAFARIWTLNSTDQVLELRGSAGLYTHLNGPHSRIPVGKLKIGQIASEKKPHLTNSVIGDPRVNDQEWAKKEGMVAFAGYPLIIDQKVLGVMALFAKKPLTPFTMESLQIVANYISVAIERQSHLEARQKHEERNAQILAETRQILNAIADMVLVKGPESRIVWANQAFQRYYGMTNEQLQDLIDAPFNEPRFTQQYLKDDAYVFTKGKILNIPEEPVTRHDGTIRYFHTVKSPIVNADEKVFRIVAVCRDITDEKKAKEALRQSEAQLRESEQRLSLALDSTISGLWDWNIETGEVFFSPHWIKSLGYTPDEVSYTVDFWKSIIHPDDFSHTMATLARHLEGHTTVYECENRLRMASGEWQWNRDRGKVVEWNAEGKPVRMVGTDMAITELKSAREEVKVLQRHEDMVLKSVGEGIYGLDRNGNATFVNPAAAHMIGWNPQELIGQPQHNILHHSKPDGSPYPRENCPIYEALKDGKIHSADSEVFWRKDGTSFPVEYTSTPLKGEDGKLVGAVVTFRDISERKRNEKIIRKAEQRFRAIYSQAPIGIGILDSISGQFKQNNQRYCDIIGYSQEELLKRTFLDVTYPDDIQQDLDNMTQLLNGTIPSFQMEKRLIRKSGEIIWVNLTCVPLWLQTTDPRQHIAIVEDITERKQSQIIHSHLLKRAIHAEEEERRRIARELHDETGQALTSLLVGLRTLQESKNLGQMKEQALKLRKITKKTIQEVQRMALGLSPSILEDLGLEAAVERLAGDFKETHAVAPTLTLKGLESQKLPFEVETSLYRIIQEALTNIAKYADAKNIDIFIDCQSSSIQMTVKDNGCGFEPTPLSYATNEPKQLGLHGMRQRAIGLGGKFLIESTPGRGTTVYVEIPLQG